jgi:hypothetical protein
MSFQVWVRWTFHNQHEAPMEKDIWVTLMENIEKVTNVNKENWINLSKTGTAGCVMDELDSSKSYSVLKKREGLNDLCIIVSY